MLLLHAPPASASAEQEVDSMSDLCHNCGDCHLGTKPQPCRLPLHKCTICHQLGHTYNFCPLGVHSVDPGYKYWMLCHNCDKWHLPEPCFMPLKQCMGCGHLGHSAVFCPLSPVARAQKETLQLAGIKRQREDDHVKQEEEVKYRPGLVILPLAKTPVRNLKHVHPELLAQIRSDAAQEVLRMLHTSTADQVAAFFSRQPGKAQSGPISLAPMRPSPAVPPDSTFGFRAYRNNFVPESFNARGSYVQSGAVQNTPAVTTPSLTRIIHTHPGDEISPFGSDEQQEQPSSMVEPAIIPPTPTTGTKSKALPKRPRSKKGTIPDCAACKRAKKRCKLHREAEQEEPAMSGPPPGHVPLMRPPQQSGTEDIRQTTEQPFQGHLYKEEQYKDEMTQLSDLSALRAASYTIQAVTRDTPIEGQHVQQATFTGHELQSQPRYHGNPQQLEWLARNAASDTSMIHTTSDADRGYVGGLQDQVVQASFVQHQTSIGGEQQQQLPPKSLHQPEQDLQSMGSDAFIQQ